MPIGRERRPRRPIMATSGGKRGALRLLALLAIVGVAVYLLMLGALHFLRPDVNPVTEPISTYGASGPYGFLFLTADLGSAVAALALTLGLYLGMVPPGPTSGSFSLAFTASPNCWRASSRWMSEQKLR